MKSWMPFCAAVNLVCGLAQLSMGHYFWAVWGLTFFAFCIWAGRGKGPSGAQTPPGNSAD